MKSARSSVLSASITVSIGYHLKALKISKSNFEEDFKFNHLGEN